MEELYYYGIGLKKKKYIIVTKPQNVSANSVTAPLHQYVVP